MDIFNILLEFGPEGLNGTMRIIVSVAELGKIFENAVSRIRSRNETYML